MSTIAMWLVKTLLILACCSPLFARKDAPSDAGVVGYLEKYGYLEPPPPNTAASRSEESLAKAISALQFFMGLNVTGIEDKETLRLIQSPRCGVRDNVESSEKGGPEEYNILGYPWRQQTVTYRITKYSNKLNRQAVDQTIARAFAVWAQYVPRKFTRVSEQADIEIRFERGWHTADTDAFDGLGGTLAHAFAPGPGIQGDVHFDEDENWTIGGSYGTDFFQVAVHEIGHALGLGHSDDYASIMFPTYRQAGFDVKLYRDDIAGIETLYGKRDGGRNGPTRNPQGPTWPRRGWRPFPWYRTESE